MSNVYNYSFPIARMTERQYNVHDTAKEECREATLLQFLGQWGGGWMGGSDFDCSDTCMNHYLIFLLIGLN